MTEVRNSILAGIAFGGLLGLIFGVVFDVNSGLVAGSLSGLAFGTILYFFVTSKTVSKQTQIENLEGKPIIHSGGANHFVKSEAVGGKLYLLTDKLQFKSHGFNIQNHEQIIDIKHIKEVTFYNTLGLVPNAASGVDYLLPE